MPVADTIVNAGDYKYYYFTNNMTVINPNANWEFLVSLSITTALGDADLFVSAIDGRNPSSEDFDFSSQNSGGDNIYLSSNATSFFTQS